MVAKFHGDNQFLILKQHADFRYYAPPKMADVWWIERIWRLMIPLVYKEPLSRTLSGFRQRINKIWKKIDSDTIIKMIHETPARLDWISKNNGNVIPNSWSSSESSLACK